MNEFKINDCITLKLENGKTNIYVDGDLFILCKGLAFKIPFDELESIEEVESIDELIETRTEFIQEQTQSNEIDSETAFWVHCSNMQTWAENDYNSDLLHYNLAFPLLRRLVEVRDVKAKRVFKEEIAKKIESGYIPIIYYLSSEGYFNYLDKNDLQTIFSSKEVAIKTLNSINIENFNDVGLINFAYILLHSLDLNEFFIYLKKLLITRSVQDDVITFFIQKLMNLVHENGCEYQEELEEVDFGIVGCLLKMIKNMDHKELTKTLAQGFSRLCSYKDPSYSMSSYYYLIFLEFLGERERIKTLLENLFIEVISSKIADIPGGHFIRVYLGKETIKERIIECLERPFGNLYPFDNAYIIKEQLLEHIDDEERKQLVEQNLIYILNNLKQFPCDDRDEIFLALLDECEYTELLDINFTKFLEVINDLPYDYQQDIFIELIERSARLGFLTQYFPILFMKIDRLQLPVQYDIFYTLIQEIKSNKLFDNFFSLIKTKFLTLIKFINKLEKSQIINAFSTLLKISKEHKWVKYHFSLFLDVIKFLPDYSLNRGVSELIESICDTEIMMILKEELESKHNSDFHRKIVKFLEIASDVLIQLHKSSTNINSKIYTTLCRFFFNLNEIIKDSTTLNNIILKIQKNKIEKGNC